MQSPVTFFYPYPEDLVDLKEIDIDDWRFWSMGWLARRRAWSLRTFLQLRRAGFEVTLSTKMPMEGIVVVGPDLEMRRAAARQLGLLRHRLFVVGIRADLPRFGFADIEVLQNGWFHNGESFVHIPHWPQPGLRPRDPSRGDRVGVVAFKGHLRNLHPGLADSAWRAQLEREGFRMEKSVARDMDADTANPWHDYRNVRCIGGSSARCYRRLRQARK